MARAVIFGSRGMLGAELVRAFRDYELFTPSGRELDITDEHAVRDYLFSRRPDLIINAAAYNSVDAAETPEGYLKAMAVNGLAPGHLAKFARLLGVPLVHYSTDQVFGHEERAGFTEAHPPGPGPRLSAYARSKLLGEKLLSAGTDKFYIIRTSRLFGERGESLGAKKSFVDVFLERAGEALVIPAVSDEIAGATYAPDLARATRDLVIDGVPWGYYHLTNHGAASWYDLAHTVVALGRKGAIVRPVSRDAFARPAWRPRFSLLLNTKRPRLRPWQEALEEYFAKKKKS
ncbi:MAG: NAD(P)-dependent oxidoreductase [bacterium]|nr:NAD(P)-dependent oxidoreductase [bacterium]